MISVAVDKYTIQVHDDGLPSIYLDYKKRALLCDEHGVAGEGTLAFVSIQKAAGWPEFCVALRYANSSAGFHPAVLVVPESETAFIGAGESIWIYDLKTPRLLSQEYVHMGFWSWHRYGQVVLMASEIEFAAWTLGGEKLWATLVEPPWDFVVEGDELTLEVMGHKKKCSILIGPGPRFPE